MNNRTFRRFKSNACIKWAIRSIHFFSILYISDINRCSRSAIHCWKRINGCYVPSSLVSTNNNIFLDTFARFHFISYPYISKSYIQFIKLSNRIYFILMFFGLKHSLSYQTFQF